MNICEKYLNKALESLQEDSDSLLAKMVKTCGKDSSIPLIMGLDNMNAGTDTTGTSATFLMYHLARNPDKQEILYKEICDIVAAKGALTESAIAKMKYIKAVQLESQRILPAIWATARVYEKDVVIGGYVIPQGSVVFRAGSYSLHPSDLSSSK